MTEFVICINNDSNPASLVLGKVYHRLSDEEAEQLDLIRVVDEDAAETDGYLYPSSMFAPIDVPEIARQVLLAGV